MANATTHQAQNMDALFDLIEGKLSGDREGVKKFVHLVVEHPTRFNYDGHSVLIEVASVYVAHNVWQHFNAVAEDFVPGVNEEITRGDVARFAQHVGFPPSFDGGLTDEQSDTLYDFLEIHA